MGLRLSALVPLLVFIAHPALSHGGGLDGYGCHHDRKRGGYHCHSGALAGRSFGSQQAMLRELGAKAPAEYGTVGPSTQGAIRSFQRDLGLPADSELSGRLLVRLAEQVRSRGSGRGSGAVR